MKTKIFALIAILCSSFFPTAYAFNIIHESIFFTHSKTALPVKAVFHFGYGNETSCSDSYAVSFSSTPVKNLDHVVFFDGELKQMAPGYGCVVIDYTNTQDGKTSQDKFSLTWNDDNYQNTTPYLTLVAIN